MIRFGTGDSAFALEAADDGRVTRISAIQGRVGAAVKVREIFVYPRAIEEVVIAVSGAVAGQAVVTREQDRDTLRLRLVLEQGADKAEASKAAAEAFQKSARIRADSVEIVDSLPEDATLLLNQKDD